MLKIAVLTSSRADFGIYLPLLKQLKKDDSFDLKILVFGTHLSRFHGYTINQIENNGFEIEERLECLVLGDSEEAISNAMGNTMTKFSSIWKKLKDEIDIVLALGDRYEMFAAVAASVPFNIKIAHLHGGETTLGAIDNKFRHAITMMSTIHFTSTEAYAKKVEALTGSKENIYNVGSLSLDNLSDMDLLSVADFKEKYNIDLSIPTILNTLHPETVKASKNAYYADVLVDVFEDLSKDYQIVITMPNADTAGSIIREKFQKLIDNNSRIIGVESFGTLGYFSCMKHCTLLLGNTSSGIIEAPSLNKYVVNVGQRQDGRARSQNVYDIDFDKEKILNLTREVAKLGNYKGKNVYKSGKNVSQQIIEILNN